MTAFVLVPQPFVLFAISLFWYCFGKSWAQVEELMSTQFPTLFSPIEIGHRTVKNRICCSAHADALAEDGMPTDRTVRYYELKARGGVGFMMCFGSASVHPTSPARDWNGVELFDDRVIPHLAKFSETMHKYAVPCVAQITHRGRRGR